MEYIQKPTGFKPMPAPMPISPVSMAPMPFPVPMPIMYPEYEPVSVSCVAPIYETKKSHGCCSYAGVILVLFILLVIISRGKI